MTITVRVLQLPFGMKFDNPLQKAFKQCIEVLPDSLDATVLEKKLIFVYTDDIEVIEMTYRSYVSNQRIWTTDRSESDLAILVWNSEGDPEAKMIAGMTVDHIALDRVAGTFTATFRYTGSIAGPTIDEWALKMKFMNMQHTGRA